MAQLGSTVVAGSLTVTDDVNLVKPLSIENGGTGATDALAAEYNILGNVATVETQPADDRYIALRNQTINASNGTFRWTKCSSVWAWIVSKITGAISGIVTSNLTASRALVSDSTGKVAVSSITSTKLGYLTDVTSNIQAQINAKAGTAVATTSANGLMSSSDKTKLDGITITFEIV